MNRNINDIFDYKTFNDKNYNFKQLICNKLKINTNELRIDTLDDLSKIGTLICNEIPISNFSVLERGSIDNVTVDEILSTIDDGGNCYNVNILFGLFLLEFGIECKLVVKPLNSTSNLKLIGFVYHACNVIKWKDGKKYYFDIAAGVFTCLTPIDIDSGVPVKPYLDCIPNALFRVIKNKDSENNSTYIYQKKTLNEDKEYKDIFEFDLNRELPLEEMSENFKRYYKYLNGIMSVIKVTNNGIYSYYHNSFTWMNSNFNKEIKIKNRQQAESIFKKYFNINLNDFRFLDNYDYS